MQHRMQRPLLLAAALLITLPAAAVAGGKAAIATDGGAMHITWKNADTLRMQTGNTPSYFIVRDGKAYSVTNAGGQPRVMDMAAMLQMMQAMGGQSAHKPARNNFASVGSVQATGATETVAGIKGRVYQMRWTEPDGTQKSGEAVLTDDPLVVEMTRAYFGSMAAMFRSKSTQSFLDGLPGDNRGLLRVGDGFRVSSVTRADPPASTFELPAKPMDLQKMMGGMGAH